MTREDYERRKLRLEEQLRAGIELLESAYRAQVRALDLVWMLQAEEGGPVAGRPERSHSGAEPASTPAPPKEEPLPAPDSPRRRSAPEVADDVRAVFSQVPETFTRNDVCAALGYEPYRGALSLALKGLVRDGIAQIESHGEGQRATVYRKNGA